MLYTLYTVKTPRLTALRKIKNNNKNPFNILIGTILSARSKDENTIKITKNLFSRYKSSYELYKANIEDIEKIIKSIGFYHVKAKRIKDVSTIISTRYDGNVPNNIDGLLGLPGVGRKTANCVLVYAFNIPAIPVDTHVHRISNRLGIVTTKTTIETELELRKRVSKDDWVRINEIFVMYGQNICFARSPLCNVCNLRSMCKYYKS